MLSVVIGAGVGIGSGEAVIQRAITDHYNRLDNASTAGSTETGQVYSVITSSWGIDTNRLKMTAGTSGRIHVDAGYANAVFRARVIGVVSNQRLVFRAIDANNEWFFNSDTLAKRVANTVTSMAVLAAPIVDGDTVMVICRGTKIRLFVNNVLKATVDDSDLSTATKFGFFSSSSATLGYFDDLFIQKLT